MYILAVGCVEVLDQNLEAVRTASRPGAYFGEGCILGDVRRRENLRAQGHVEVCQLLSHDIDVLLDTYPHLQRRAAEARISSAKRSSCDSRRRARSIRRSRSGRSWPGDVQAVGTQD